MNQPGISIIIPTYQGERDLRGLLPALRTQDYKGEIEIVAVDSSSTDQTVEVLRQYGAVIHIIPQYTFTHGYARNLAVASATQELVAFMSQDVEITSDSFLTQLAALLGDPDISAATVRQLPRPNATPLEVFFHLELYPPQIRQIRKWDRQRPLRLEDMFFSNVCSITYRELCQRYPFDERLVMSEDQFFAKQLLLNGHSILYSAEPAVVHSHHYSLMQLFRRNFDSAYSLIGIADDSWRESVGRGAEYLLKELGYVIRRGHWLWIPIVPVYEVTRAVGRIMGRYAHLLPRKWRSFLGLHRHYWESAS